MEESKEIFSEENYDFGFIGHVNLNGLSMLNKIIEYGKKIQKEK